MYKNERTAHLKKRMIGDTPFTIEWVLKALNDKQSDWTNASAGRRVSTILAQKIGEGKGYASNVYKLTVEFDRGEPYYLALKIPTPEIFLKKFEQPNANESHNSIAAAHSRECNFYRTFSGKGLCLPVIYAAQELIPGKQPGAILMQYMGDVGCNVPPHESFTLKQVRDI
ncbi:unnamed protein product [Toxocara canis]|uniref:ATP-binding protein n=1 Tax=Toxocara canis TaxID=6265 RepID=A0A183V2V5_TOXCA|nr:unnamed protein product [Toxocara canis]